MSLEITYTLNQKIMDDLPSVFTKIVAEQIAAQLEDEVRKKVVTDQYSWRDTVSSRASEILAKKFAQEKAMEVMREIDMKAVINATFFGMVSRLTNPPKDRP